MNSWRAFASAPWSYLQFALSEPHAYRIMFSLHDDAREVSAALKREQARSFSYLLSAVEASRRKS